MNRSKFLKVLLTVVVAPKILIEANVNYLAEREGRWLRNYEIAKRGLYRVDKNHWDFYEPNAERLHEEIKYQAKIKDLIDKKPPKGIGMVYHKGEIKLLRSRKRLLCIYHGKPS